MSWDIKECHINQESPMIPVPAGYKRLSRGTYKSVSDGFWDIKEGKGIADGDVAPIEGCSSDSERRPSPAASGRFSPGKSRRGPGGPSTSGGPLAAHTKVVVLSGDGAGECTSLRRMLAW